MDHERRAVLKAGAAAALLLQVRAAKAAETATAATTANGKAGDFDFLAGSWRIRNKQRKADGSWDEFEGESTCWTILGGVGSVEELRIPARKFGGMGLRLLDVEKRVWNDFWVNAKSGVLGAAGLTGVFVNGVGEFTAEDEEDGKPVKYRGVWDQITPTSCRWRQGVSRDGSKSWDDSWFMDWTRVA